MSCPLHVDFQMSHCTRSQILFFLFLIYRGQSLAVLSHSAAESCFTSSITLLPVQLSALPYTVIFPSNFKDDNAEQYLFLMTSFVQNLHGMLARLYTQNIIVSLLDHQSRWNLTSIPCPISSAQVNFQARSFFIFYSLVTFSIIPLQWTQHWQNRLFMI